MPPQPLLTSERGPRARRLTRSPILPCPVTPLLGPGDPGAAPRTSVAPHGGRSSPGVHDLLAPSRTRRNGHSFASTRRVIVNTRQKIHLLLGDVVAKKAVPNGPVDVLEQAVLALVDCIEILADAVDDIRDRLDAPVLPQLAADPDPVPDQMADLRRQVKDLSKVVKKLNRKK
jgi:hypothetical protein